MLSYFFDIWYSSCYAYVVYAIKDFLCLALPLSFVGNGKGHESLDVVVIALNAYISQKGYCYLLIPSQHAQEDTHFISFHHIKYKLRIFYLPYFNLDTICLTFNGKNILSTIQYFALLYVYLLFAFTKWLYGW